MDEVIIDGRDMRILILGGDGMLGHQLLKSWESEHDVYVTLHRNTDAYMKYGMFNSDNSYYGIDVCNHKEIASIINTLKPEAVVNAVGIVKQRIEARDTIQSIEINSLLPHYLSVLCDSVGTRLIHISTDCVFSGSKGMYTENDLEDATDLYGRSKLLGEVSNSNTVTLRTSIIGLELSRKKSLIEWFLAEDNNIRGYSGAIYSGFCTIEIARVINNILMNCPELSGLWHLASDPINKFELLKKLMLLLDRKDIEIEEDNNFICDRSLDGTRFNREVGYKSPSWDKMLNELAQQILEREK